MKNTAPRTPAPVAGCRLGGEACHLFALFARRYNLTAPQVFALQSKALSWADRVGLWCNGQPCAGPFGALARGLARRGVITAQGAGWAWAPDALADLWAVAQAQAEAEGLCPVPDLADAAPAPAQPATEATPPPAPSIADAALEASAAINAEGEAATARALAGIGRIRAGLETLANELETLEAPEGGRPVLTLSPGHDDGPYLAGDGVSLWSFETEALARRAALAFQADGADPYLAGPGPSGPVTLPLTPRVTLPGEATPPPAPSHGDRAPRLPELCPDPEAGTPTRAEAVWPLRCENGGVAVVVTGSDREAFRLPGTLSLCGAAAALEAGGWLLSPALEALAQRWRDQTGGEDPSAEAVAIAEAAAPLARRFEVFHRTWWQAPGVPGVGESHHVGWAQTEARARYLCKKWNASHTPGPLSDRAEYTAA